VYAPEIRVTLAAVPGDPQACEVTMTVDLRNGLSPNLWGYGIVSSGGAGIAGLIAGAIAKKALLLTGAAIAGPAVAVAGATGIALLMSAGAIYRWEVRKTSDELRAALAAIEGAMRALDIFGDNPPPPPPPTASGDGGAFLAIVS
jgi:hypothetical protein